MAVNGLRKMSRGFGTSQLVSEQSLFDQHWAEMFSQLEENAKLLQELRNSTDLGQGIWGSGTKNDRRFLSSESRSESRKPMFDFTESNHQSQRKYVGVLVSSSTCFHSNPNFPKSPNPTKKPSSCETHLQSSPVSPNSTQISSSKETQRRCSTKCLSEPLRSTKNLQGSLRRSWGNWNRSPKVDVDLSPTSESRKKKTKKPQSSRLHRFPTPDARKKKTKKLQSSRLHRKPKLKKPPWPTLSKRKPKLKIPPWLISSKKKKKPNKKPPVSNVSAMASNTVLAMASNGAKRIIRGLRSSALILKFLPNFVRHLSNKARRNCGNIGIAQVAAASWANSPSDEESLPSACKEHALQKELIGQGTEKLDLQGKVVVLGFIDSHVHLIAGGLQMGRAELRDVKRQEDFVQKVKEDVRDKTPGEWVLGHGWNNDIWGALPGASWIDGITHDNPVWLSRRDGHMGVANSLALKIAGITNITKDPVGGSILRTMDGEPTGVLVDSAMKLVLDVIPEVSVSERRNALLKASKYALKKGVTTVVDVGRYIPGTPVDHPWQDLSDVYMWADSAGKMLIRVCLFFPMQSWSRLAEFREKKGSSLSQWIYLGGVKAFADGSLGSNSALFHEPYEDDPHNYGLRVTDFDWLLNATLASDRSGLQVAIHAIGDKANDVVLDLFDTVASSNGVRDRRFRVEHAQHLMPGSIIRFGQQGVIASVQPDHLLDDAGSAEKKIGIARAQKGSYLFQSLLAGKAHLSFGSDWPVADINPLRSIQTAITRVPPGWETAWIPTERVGLLDALNAHTTSAAYACFLDHELGSLSPGKYADFIVLDATSWNEFAEQDVTSRTVEATYVSGVQAYP